MIQKMAKAKKKIVNSGGTTTTTEFAQDGWKTHLDALGQVMARMGSENWDTWADLDGSNNLQTRYLRGDLVDQLFAREDSAGNVYWTLTDRLGSIRTVIDNSANVKDQIFYDGWGNPTGTNSFAGRYLWTGRDYDTETNLQYNRARTYDPHTGRWISQDPLGFDAGDSNLYRYVKNQPTIATDPNGEKIVIKITQLPSGFKSHGQIWVLDRNCKEGYTYDGNGPGRVPGLAQIILSNNGYFLDDFKPFFKGPFKDPIKKLGEAGAKNVIVISDGDYRREKLALDLSFKYTRQIPLYNSLKLNSNTWAKAMLENATKYVAMDFSKVNIPGFNSGGIWGYGGSYFDKAGDPTMKMLKLVKEWLSLNPLPNQPDKQRQFEAGKKLKMIFDARGKMPTNPLPSLQEFEKMLKNQK